MIKKKKSKICDFYFSSYLFLDCKMDDVEGIQIKVEKK